MRNKAKLLYARLYHLIQPKFRLASHRWKNFIDEKKQSQILYCIGDSHNELFEYIDKNNLLPLSIRCVTVQGATIFGLANPNSKTNAMPIFKNELLNAPHGSNLTIILGEIDCGFLLWLRSDKNGTSIEHEMAESLSRYKDFLLWIKALSFNKIIVVSVPPQTISDEDKRGDVANARKSVSASLSERGKLTAQYNKDLKHVTEEINIDFLDMDDRLVDSKTSLVHKHLLNMDPSDHHLCPSSASSLYAEKIKACIPCSNN